MSWEQKERKKKKKKGHCGCQNVAAINADYLTPCVHFTQFVLVSFFSFKKSYFFI